MLEALRTNLPEQLEILPINLANHLLITVVALLAGLAISLPLGVLVARRQRWRYPALTAVSIIQTIPSLALLALMVPVLVGVAALLERAGIEMSALGFWPTVVALTLYSMLPVVRNTVTGILGVDPAVTEAARGVGMTPRQQLFRVELPIAAPVILAGIRTATVWVVGIATLSTPVGQRSLGNFIFRGLQTRNWTMVLVGCVSAALLAILLDLLIGGLERSAAKRRRGLGIACGAGLAAVLLAGLLGPTIVRATAGDARRGVGSDTVVAERTDRPTIRIGAKTFTEQYILAELIADVLQARQFETRVVSSLGSTVVFDALASGEIDVYVDYSGTIWANYMKRTGSGGRDEVMEAMTWWLAQEHSIRCLGSLGFENAYALAMRSDRAKEMGVRTISDLATHSARMKIGGDYEFFGRPEWYAVRDGYGLNFADQVSYDSSFMYQSVAQDETQVIAAFSSDGRIAAYDLVTLEDPRQMLPPYDAVLLIGPTLADDPELATVLRRLVGAIPVELMREANYRVDRDEDSQSAAAAAQWLGRQIEWR